MALTVEAEQRLTLVKMTDFFAAHQNEWQAAAKRAYDFVRATFPAGSTIRHDDVAQILTPVFLVDPRLRAELDRKKLTQKYWISDFTDLVIDRTWATIAANQGV